MNARHKRWVTGGLIAAAAFVMVLWSWNTLAAFLGAPEAQARHVVAALILLGTLRFALVPRGNPSRHGRARHGHPTR